MNTEETRNEYVLRKLKEQEIMTKMKTGKMDMTNKHLVGMTVGKLPAQENTEWYRWEVPLITIEELFGGTPCNCICHQPQKDGDFISHIEPCCINGIKYE